MPSKYSVKIPKAITKQDSNLPYKSHFKAQRIQPKCTNCGRDGMLDSKYSKCRCGGTIQTYGC